MKTDDVVLLYTTWPDQETARAMIEKALNTNLIACANMLNPHQAFYRWDNTIRCDSEVIVLMKTTAGRAEALRTTVIAAHPYETPAFIVVTLETEMSHGPFIDWVRSATLQ
jgi:periplasmic divalent cation tolerance protein